jgi:hypothetical protein
MHTVLDAGYFDECRIPFHCYLDHEWMGEIAAAAARDATKPNQLLAFHVTPWSYLSHDLATWNYTSLFRIEAKIPEHNSPFCCYSVTTSSFAQESYCPLSTKLTPLVSASGPQAQLHAH